MAVTKSLLAVPTLAFLLAATGGCAARPGEVRLYRHAKHGYTVAVPAGWSVQEEEDGSLRLEADGPKDANGQAATIYIMVVDKPHPWSWAADVADLPNHFDHYAFLAEGTTTHNAVAYHWVSFACGEGPARHRNLNCVIPLSEKVITLACFADEQRYADLEATFQECIFNIDPGALRAN